MKVNHLREGLMKVDAPLADFSRCHLGILSQLKAFAELPALQAAAERSRKVAANMLALHLRHVPYVVGHIQAPVVIGLKPDSAHKFGKKPCSGSPQAGGGGVFAW